MKFLKLSLVATVLGLGLTLTACGGVDDNKEKEQVHEGNKVQCDMLFADLDHYEQVKDHLTPQESAEACDEIKTRSLGIHCNRKVFGKTEDVSVTKDFCDSK
jgi:hypothetical protein